jgi:2,3-bisphosphoglycerate-independent phosphoglycerate mutase
MIVLAILDGWGVGKKSWGNATLGAGFIQGLRNNYPTCILKCHGPAVGLPKGFQGNSEVGHINIGAGRVVYQMLEIINRKIKSRAFFSNKALVGAVKAGRNSALHIMGLLSDEGVHSHQNHLFALLKLAKIHKLKNVKIHVFADGRDTLPKSAWKYLLALEKVIKKLGIGEIATISGRYYAMDRDNRWERIEKAYACIADGKGMHFSSWRRAVAENYRKGVSDEFIVPAVLGDYAGVNDNDSVILFNYRLDRARQITHAFTDKSFSHFKREKKKAFYCAFAPYYDGMNARVAFSEPKLANILGEAVADNGLRQFRIAETEKYAHVTFFFNGQKEAPFKNEERVIIPSPKVATYDLKPEMSAFEVTKVLVEKILLGNHDLLVVNYANGDMVGHTGSYASAVKAVKAVDSCIKSVYDAVIKKKGILIVTADHGNCEEMVGKKGEVLTSHSVNDVQFTLIGADVKLRNGVLADIAPTVLQLFGVRKPKEMSGSSLIK